jgi:deoxyhypusine monooxygenase
MQSVYYLRHYYKNNINNEINKVIIEKISESLLDKSHGVLMRHEFAYVLGQLQNEYACDCLEEILTNTFDNDMVRHECAEALGSIGKPRSIYPLKKCCLDKSKELSETCEIALNFINWKLFGDRNKNDEPITCACMISPYSSVDPSPSYPSDIKITTDELAYELLNINNSIFNRYRSIFSLRNRGDSNCVIALGECLISDNSSVLLRHEVAYVLGQLQNPLAFKFLEISLRNKNEHYIVRHESAEALGAINEKFYEVKLLLNEFLSDDNKVIRESCQVALDTIDYWNNKDNFIDLKSK